MKTTNPAAIAASTGPAHGFHPADAPAWKINLPHLNAPSSLDITGYNHSTSSPNIPHGPTKYSSGTGLARPPLIATSSTYFKTENQINPDSKEARQNTPVKWRNLPTESTPSVGFIAQASSTVFDSKIRQPNIQTFSSNDVGTEKDRSPGAVPLSLKESFVLEARKSMVDIELDNNDTMKKLAEMEQTVESFVELLTRPDAASREQWGGRNIRERSTGSLEIGGTWQQSPYMDRLELEENWIERHIRHSAYCGSSTSSSNSTFPGLGFQSQSRQFHISRSGVRTSVKAIPYFQVWGSNSSQASSLWCDSNP